MVINDHLLIEETAESTVPIAKDSKKMASIILQVTSQLISSSGE
jgi:hypothetical protein